MDLSHSSTEWLNFQVVSAPHARPDPSCQCRPSTGCCSVKLAPSEMTYVAARWRTLLPVCAGLAVCYLAWISVLVRASDDESPAASLSSITKCLTCTDNPTPDGFSCSQQARWGKCDTPWLVRGDYCALTCRRCCPTKPTTPIIKGTYNANLDPTGDLVVVLHGVDKPQSRESGGPPPILTRSREAPSSSQFTATQARAPERSLQLVLDPPSPAEPAEAPKAADPVPEIAAGSKPPLAPPSDSAALEAPISKQYACGDNTIKSVLQAERTAQKWDTFISATHWSGLDDSFSAPNAQATLLIPVDSAWARFAADTGTSISDLLTNVTALRSIVLYHLLPQSYTPSDLKRTPVIKTYWRGHDLYGTFSGDDLALGSGTGRNAKILNGIKVCNSYLYSLDSVLLPSKQLGGLPQLAEYNPQDKECSQVSALDILKADKGLSTTTRVLNALGYSEALSNLAKPLSVLAPTNNAWDAAAKSLNMSTATLLDGLTNKDNLKAIGDLHLLPRDLNCNGNLCAGSFTSLNSKAGPVYISGTQTSDAWVQSMATRAKVVPDAPRACPSFKVVRIDAVLLPAPPSIAPQVSSASGA